MSPYIAASPSSGTAAEISPIQSGTTAQIPPIDAIPPYAGPPPIAGIDQAVYDRWAFNRARTDREHTAFRERMQFQSADFHQFLYQVARNSPKIAVPSPSWKNIPWPVPVRSPVVTQEPEGQHLEMNASFDEIQEAPLRRASPMDFGNQLEQSAAALAIPAFTFDRPSYDGELGDLSINQYTTPASANSNRETLIKVGAVFEELIISSELSGIEMVNFGDHEYQEQGRKKQRNCVLASFSWIARKVGKLF